MLWHRLQAGDAASCVDVLARCRDALAFDAQTDALVDELARSPLDARQRVRLGLALAALSRLRDAADAERTSLEAALRDASAAGDRLMVGVVCGALGKYCERRDTDRALAYYQDGAEALWQAGLGSGAEDTEAGEMCR